MALTPSAGDPGRNRTINDTIAYTGDLLGGYDAVTFNLFDIQDTFSGSWTLDGNPVAVAWNTDSDTTAEDVRAAMAAVPGASSAVLKITGTNQYMITVFWSFVATKVDLIDTGTVGATFAIVENADGLGPYSTLKYALGVRTLPTVNVVVQDTYGKAVWLAYDQTNGSYCFGVNTTDETGAIIDTTYYSTADGSVYVPGGNLIPIENIGKTICPIGADNVQGSFTDAAAVDFVAMGIDIPTVPIATRCRVYVYMDPTGAAAYEGNCATWTTNGETPVYSAGAQTGFPVANNGYIDLDYSEFNTFKIIGNEAAMTHGIYVQFYS